MFQEMLQLRPLGEESMESMELSTERLGVNDGGGEEGKEAEGKTGEGKMDDDDYDDAKMEY